MTSSQKFLLDNKKLGRLLKVETYEVTRTLNKPAISGKKQTVTKKKYVITGYNRTKVKEEIPQEDGTSTTVEKEKFVKWAEFSFAEVLHPKDRIREFLTKVELPLSYITDKELVEEADRRELLRLELMSDEIMIKEMKRRGLTEFANNFKISKNASFFQKLKARIWERKKIPDSKLSFEQTVEEIKKRHLLLPKDFLSTDELLKELQKRDIRVELKDIPKPLSTKQKESLESLFEDEDSIPPSPEELDISQVTPTVDLT